MYFDTIVCVIRSRSLGSLIRPLAIFIRCQDNGDLTQYSSESQSFFRLHFTSPCLAPLASLVFINYLKSIDLKMSHTTLDESISIRFLSVSGGGSKNSERHLRMINSIMIMISIIIFIYYLSWSLSEMESKYPSLCKPHTYICI